MKRYNRELLVMLKTSGTNEKELERQLTQIHFIAHLAEAPEMFCAAHELAKRFKIIQKKKDILKAAQDAELKPFHFLINKN